MRSVSEGCEPAPVTTVDFAGRSELRTWEMKKGALHYFLFLLEVIRDTSSDLDAGVKSR